MSVRTATTRDVDDLAALYVSVAEEGRWLAAEPPIDHDQRAARIESRLGSPWTVDLVAVADDGYLVGHLVAIASDYAPAEIAMVVRDGWRRRGIGQTLMEAAIDWARDEGVHKLSLEVFPWRH